ncbi:hypothetical protein EON63_22190, partial [archaeon]
MMRKVSCVYGVLWCMVYGIGCMVYVDNPFNFNTLRILILLCTCSDFPGYRLRRTNWYKDPSHLVVEIDFSLSNPHILLKDLALPSEDTWILEEGERVMKGGIEVEVLVYNPHRAFSGEFHVSEMKDMSTELKDIVKDTNQDIVNSFYSVKDMAYYKSLADARAREEEDTIIRERCGWYEYLG